MNKKQKEVYEKVLIEMSVAIQKKDLEAAHNEEDDLLCELLISLGFQDIVDLYNDGEKWYC